MQSQQALGGACGTCKAATLSTYRPRLLHRPTSSAQWTMQRCSSRRRRRSINTTAQAQSEKREQEGSSSAQEGPNPKQEGQADNVPSPSQEQLPNQQEVTMNISQEDLATLKDAIRKQKGGGGADEGNFVDGILEEVKLISWPNPVQAFMDTLVVIAIVLGTAVTLFAVNTVLADVSKLLY